MKIPSLSIITINFNNLEGLAKTVESVLSQTFKDFEYIVIDGGSTDGSAAYLTENKDRIDYCVSEKDTGIYNAMNKGIKVSKGEFLLFLNSGDTLHTSTALSDFITHREFKGDIIYGDYKFNNGEKIYPDMLPTTYFMKTSLPHQSTFFKRSVFYIMGYYDEKYSMGADRAFYIKCFLSGKFHFKHIRYFLTRYDLTGLSNDPTFLKKKEKEDEQILTEFYGEDFEKYKRKKARELKRKAKNRNSLLGIVKRIYNRINKIWNRR